MGNVMGANTDDEIILETKRLVLRRLRRSDYGALCLMLKDEEVMYAYEHAFEDWELSLIHISGRLQADSAAGEGSCFSLYFPYVNPQRCV